MEVKYFTHTEYAYKRTVRQYKQCNYEEFNAELRNINGATCVFAADNIDEVYTKFTHILNNTLDNHIPKKIITICPKNKSFMNNTISNT